MGTSQREVRSSARDLLDNQSFQKPPGHSTQRVFCGLELVKTKQVPKILWPRKRRGVSRVAAPVRKSQARGSTLRSISVLALLTVTTLTCVLGEALFCRLSGRRVSARAHSPAAPAGPRRPSRRRPDSRSVLGPAPGPRLSRPLGGSQGVTRKASDRQPSPPVSGQSAELNAPARSLHPIATARTPSAADYESQQHNFWSSDSMTQTPTKRLAPDITEDEAREMWMGPPHTTFVAVDAGNEV